MVAAHNLEAFPALVTSGFSSRPPTPGPEYAIVEEFVRSSLPAAPRGQVRTVFVEPRIASGYPDIVVVYWHAATARQWSSNRAQLTPRDFRVLQHLRNSGPADAQQLRAAHIPDTSMALARLQAADLILRRAGMWCVRALDRIFAVRRLIAIEAKVHEWRKGISQALQNTWFASESYLLLGRLPRHCSPISEATRLGIGVVVQNQFLDNAEAIAPREQLPKSYVSWLFNDWAWRTSLSLQPEYPLYGVQGYSQV